ncbi:MAG: thiamine-phosphate kinase [Balneolaceae bacterium]|nr:thiamine-phosphate kinase [Balneolaceae bacterium]
MKLDELGEFGFINTLAPAFEHLAAEGMTGIGDDCAILPMNDHEDLLVTTDLLIEDVHFLREAISPLQLGHKALAVSLSDIAGMGGSPIASFMSIAIPLELDVAYLDEVMDGYRTLSEEYQLPLLGGDTTKSMKAIAINVCVLGKCHKDKVRLRSMALPGDVICVTGCLGDSAGGLQLLLDEIPLNNEHKGLLEKHHQPEPRVKEALFLSSFEGVHAMMDISDGIASDLSHILNASGVSAKVCLEDIPLSDELKSISQKNKWDALGLALGGGEDYELLFTVQKDKLTAVQQEFEERFETPLYPIGGIEEGATEIRWMKESREVRMSNKGFTHFESPDVL